MIDEHFQIGEVADSVGLSLRSIRYYEEIGLVAPSGRTEGGFRLYTDSDVERLRLVKALKPIGMSLESIGELLVAADALVRPGGSVDPDVGSRLHSVLSLAHDRCDQLEEHLAGARAALGRLATLTVAPAR